MGTTAPIKRVITEPKRAGAPNPRRPNTTTEG
jgi:hypothetical protein